MMWLAFQATDVVSEVTNANTLDVTKVTVATIAAVASTIAARYAYMFTRKMDTATTRVIESTSTATLEHGEVVVALNALRTSMNEANRANGERFGRLDESMSAMTEAHTRHLDWHLNHPPKEPRQR
jgi:LPS O-antigen subunit length determinant protein (WzzB/FepE family)